VKVASTDPSVLECDDCAVGQLLRTTGIVQCIAFESRLEERTEVAITVTTMIVSIIQNELDLQSEMIIDFLTTFEMSIILKAALGVVKIGSSIKPDNHEQV